MRLFVYGTLQPGYANYQRYCNGSVTAARPALVQGALYALPAGYPAMTTGKDWVKGWLLEFADVTLLRVLDELEGYDPAGPPEDNLYERGPIAVFDRQQQFLATAWVYRMAPEQIELYQGDYLTSGQWI